MAPEIKALKEDGQFDPLKADLFSIGVVFFILYFGFPPFEVASQKECNFFKFWCQEGPKKYF
jgi:hypothetical protein